MSGNRRRVALVTTAAAVLAAAAVLVAVLVLNRANAGRAERFREAASENWSMVGGLSEDVAVALLRVSSPEDLAAVAAASKGMSSGLEEIGRSLKGQAVPSGYSDIAESQKIALDALHLYTEKIEKLATGADQQMTRENTSVLESRSRKAKAAVERFLSEADFLDVVIAGDFYQSGKALGSAWQPPPYAGEEEAQAVYDTVSRFMEADIRDSDFDTLLSLLSSRMVAVLEYLGFTREKLQEGWLSSWGGKKPVDYYISRRNINIPFPETATVVAIAYLEGGGTRVETIRLVKEQGVWKIDNYPFVGWLG